jgi:hypothetical protein
LGIVKALLELLGKFCKRVRMRIPFAIIQTCNKLSFLNLNLYTCEPQVSKLALSLPITISSKAGIKKLIYFGGEKKKPII